MGNATIASRPQVIEILPLTGLRFIAALWVLIFHLVRYFPEINKLVSNHKILYFINNGYLGVDIFFILSGFILSYNYASSEKLDSVRKYIRFLGIRLARIYPLHLLTLFVMVPIVFASRHFKGEFPEGISYATFLKNIFLVQSWSYPVVLSWNEPAWSVSCEWFAYLALPIYLFIAKIMQKYSAVLSLFSLVIMILVAKITNFDKSAPYGSLRIIFEFLSGCLIFQFYNTNNYKKKYKQHSFFICQVILLLSIIALCSITPPYFKNHAICLIPIAILFYTFTLNKGLLASALSLRSVCLLGRSSYAIYMIQFPFIIFLHKYLTMRPIETTLCQYIFFASFVILLILSGIITHIFIEEPARQYLCRIIKKI